jgi:hypothetical protein
VSHAGELVTRDEIRAHVWGQDTFVDFEHGLNFAIQKIRAVLGDDTDSPRYIETLPRRGYRFVAPLDELNEASLLDAAPTSAVRLNPDLPPKPETVINKALEKDRELRYPSAAEMRADLKRLGRDTESGRAVTAEQTTRASPALTKLGKKLAILAAIVLVLLLAALATWLSFPPPRPKVVGSDQITNNGLPKGRMVSDGMRLYFEEPVAGITALVQVSSKGGETARIPVPLQRPVIYDISPSRSELLVSSGVIADRVREVQLWIVPIPAGAPHRVGDILAHDACWAPDGVHLVYANGHDLYFVGADGGEVQKIATVAGFPGWIRFSPDGSRLRFSVDDMKHSPSLWEITADGKGLHRLLADGCCGSWSPDGKYYYFNVGGNIWALPESKSILHGMSSTPVQLTTGPLAFLASVSASMARGCSLLVTRSEWSWCAMTAMPGSLCPFWEEFRRERWMSPATASGLPTRLTRNPQFGGAKRTVANASNLRFLL